MTQLPGQFKTLYRAPEHEMERDTNVRSFQNWREAVPCCRR